GVNEEFAWEKMQRFMKAGEPLSKNSPQEDILISTNIANSLQIEVGNEVVVAFVRGNNKVRRKLRVSGIYNTGLEEYDKRFILGSMAMLQQILDWEPTEVAGIEVFLDDLKDADVIADYVYNSVIPMNLYAETIQ